MEHLIHLIKLKIREIIIFALIFTVIGHYVPDIYLRYFDKRDYYMAKNVQMVELEFKRCDVAHITFDRTALVDLDIRRKADLIRITENGEQQVFTSELIRDFAKDGTIEIESTKEIPCEIRHDGTYKFRFFITYTIFDRERIYIFESPQFKIKS